MSDWLQVEVETIVSAYFGMLDQELRGISFSKRKVNRELMPLLNGRTLGSVEFKHANISAVLLEAGYPYVDGYKPRSNCQNLLRETVEARLSANSGLQIAVKNRVDDPAIEPAKLFSLADAIVGVPAREKNSSPNKIAPVRKPALFQGVNYLEREARNASLGKAGELFVLEVEYARLLKAGKPKLAERIEHVSQTKGDGLGYDVLSFEDTGKERLIEVKTTRFGRMTPFFASSNEVKASSTLDNYFLYRVFKFDANPKLFMLSGSLEKACQLEPTQYRASLR